MCGTRLKFLSPELLGSALHRFQAVFAPNSPPLLHFRGLKQAVLRILRAGVQGIEITTSIPASLSLLPLTAICLPRLPYLLADPPLLKFPTPTDCTSFFRCTRLDEDVPSEVSWEKNVLGEKGRFSCTTLTVEYFIRSSQHMHPQGH